MGCEVRKEKGSPIASVPEHKMCIYGGGWRPLLVPCFQGFVKVSCGFFCRFASVLYWYGMHRSLENRPQQRTVEWCYQLASRCERLTGSSVRDDELIQTMFELVTSERDSPSRNADHGRVTRLAASYGADPADYHEAANVVRALYPDSIRDAARFSQLLRDPTRAVQAAHQNPAWVEYFHGTKYAPMVARWYADRGDLLRAASLMDGHDPTPTDSQDSYQPEPHLGEGESDAVEALGGSIAGGLDEYHDLSAKDASGGGDPDHWSHDGHEAEARTDALLVDIATAYPTPDPFDGDDVGGDTEFGGDGYDDHT